jgi:hypothetical protein
MKMSNQDITIFGNEHHKSKNVALYLIHDRIKEFSLNIECFNRSQFLTNNFDVVINCNCHQYKKEVLEISSRIRSPKTIVHIDYVNDGGYMMGPMEQTSNSFNLILEYELMMQLHADVYLMNDFAVQKFVKDYYDTPEDKRCDFYAFPLPNRDNQFAYDFWFMKPSEKSNIFKEWKSVRETRRPTPGNSNRTEGECYLFDAIERNSLSVGYYDRSPVAGMNCDYERSSGILHTHNFDHALQTFKEIKI